MPHRKYTVAGPTDMVVDGEEARVDVFTSHFQKIKKRIEKAT